MTRGAVLWDCLRCVAAPGRRLRAKGNLPREKVRSRGTRRRSSGPNTTLSEWGQSPAPSGFLDQAHEPEQNTRPDERDQDGADQSEAGIYAEQAKYPSANDRADHADDDVHQHAEAAAPHHFS